MRVAYVCADPGVPVFGTKGSSVHVQEVVRALREAGADLEIFATRFDGSVPDDLAAVGTHWLSALPKGDLIAREKASLGSNVGLYGQLSRAGPFDFVYERYSLWSYAGMEYARDHGIAGILEVNAPLIEEQARHRGLVDRVGAERVAQRAFDAATAIVVVSREVGQYLEKFPGTSGRVHVIPNGVNAKRFRPDVEPLMKREAGVFRVGFVGTLKPWHGLAVLARAFGALHARLPQTRLIIGGDGPERSSFTRMLEAENALGATMFLGSIDPDAMPAILTSLDAALAPYPSGGDFYFSPLKIFEYMAAGLPVVASAIGQIPEIITSGVNGVLCPPGDAECFCASLAGLAVDPVRRQRLGRAARDSIVREHTWSHIVERIIGLGVRPAGAANGSVGVA